VAQYYIPYRKTTGLARCSCPYCEHVFIDECKNETCLCELVDNLIYHNERKHTARKK